MEDLVFSGPTQRMFGFTGNPASVSDTTRQLVLEVVPEPGTALLVGLGLLVLARRRGDGCIADLDRSLRAERVAR